MHSRAGSELGLDLVEWAHRDYQGQRSVNIRMGRPDWMIQVLMVMPSGPFAAIGSIQIMYLMRMRPLIMTVGMNIVGLLPVMVDTGVGAVLDSPPITEAPIPGGAP